MNYTSKAVYQYISEKTNDPIVEWKICAVSGQEFAVYQSDVEFYDKISPTFAGKKFQIPTPRLCPEERTKRRLAWRNERKLYKRECDYSGKKIVSLYKPNNGYRVYDHKIWWGDSWSGIVEDYNRNDSFNKNFDKVMKTTPIVNLYVKNSENCEFNSIVTDSKDCYMCTSTGFVKNVYYGTLTGWLDSCVDAYWLLNSQECYESIDCDKCYSCAYIQECVGCSNSRFLFDCINCKDCFLCVGQQGKSYMIGNQQLTKEQYKETMTTILSNHEIFEKYYNNFTNYLLQRPRHNHHVQSENCIGGMIKESKNCTLCFDIVDCHDCKYLTVAGLALKDVYDCSGGDIFQSTLCYECGMIPMNHHVLFSYGCRESSELLYCFNCISCKDCFGCTGLRDKQYCIFNVQFEKNEYEIRVVELIENMKKEGTRGEFFSPGLSPFGYNETVAVDYYKCSKEEVVTQGYGRSDYEYHINLPENAPIIDSTKYDDEEWKNLVNDETISHKIIICETSGKPFRIVKQELEFYSKHSLSLPKRHPDVRHQDRIKKRPGTTLYLRKCDKTGEEILSVYPQETSFPVYSEEAYTKEFYS